LLNPFILDHNKVLPSAPNIVTRSKPALKNAPIGDLFRNLSETARMAITMPHLVKSAPIAALLAACFLAWPAFAHPHVWVTVETELTIDAKKEIAGFKHKWTFDEFYTEFAIQGLDTNGDGIYSEEELKPLAQTNVEALKEFEYFTFPIVAGQKMPLKEPVDYRLEYKEKLLSLYFTLPLEKPIPLSEAKNFSFSVYDPGLYVALTFDKKTPVKIASPQPVKCTPLIDNKATKETTLAAGAFSENIDPASNFGAQFAQKVTLDCKG